MDGDSNVKTIVAVVVVFTWFSSSATAAINRIISILNTFLYRLFLKEFTEKTDINAVWGIRDRFDLKTPPTRQWIE